MARYGALTALQAALLGISGGAQGLVQAREREQKEGERRKQFEREELRDQREIARDEANRKYQEAQLRQQAAELTQRGELTRAEIAQRDRASAATAGSAAAERTLRKEELDAKRKSLLDEAVGWWNQTMIPTAGEPVTPERQAAATRAKRTFDRMRAADKQRPAEELIAAAYAAEQAFQLAESRRTQKAPARPTFALNAPTTTPDGRPLMPTAPAGGQRKSFMDRAMELKAQPGMTPEKAKAQMASEGYDVINMR